MSWCNYLNILCCASALTLYYPFSPDGNVLSFSLQMIGVAGMLLQEYLQDKGIVAQVRID